MPKHHPFSPSRLQRRALCPASYRIEKDLEDVETNASRKGAYRHELIAQAINNITLICKSSEVRKNDKEFFLYDLDWNKITSIANNRMNNDESIFILEVMKFIVQTSKLPWGVCEMRVETEKRLEYTDSMGNLLYHGTADFVVEDIWGGLYIFDWKTGNGAVPLVRESLQLKAYALAAMQTYKVNSCRCFIFNPYIKRKPYNEERYKSHSTFKSKEKLEKEILGIINRCKAVDAPMIRGNHCCFCLGNVHQVCSKKLWQSNFYDNIENQLNTSEIKYEIQKEQKSVEKPIINKYPTIKRKRKIKFPKYDDPLPKKEISSDEDGCAWGCLILFFFACLFFLIAALS